jgi:hypothetical protein
MIRYRLKCQKGHEFEAWFASSAAYDKQAKRRQITCARCGSTQVAKALMAPKVAKRTAKAASARTADVPAPASQRVAAHGELRAAMRRLRAEIEANSEYVGPRFPDEARKIHYEEVPARGIRGEATPDEAKALREEGIEFFPLPPLPEDHN